MNIFRGNRRFSPASAVAVYQRGLAAFEQGQFLDAIAELTEIAEQRSLSGTLACFYLGQAHLQQGLNELRLGRYPAAIRHLTSARELNPTAAGLPRYLLAGYVGADRFDLAVAELEKDRDTGSNDELLPIRLAYALMRDGQHERAVATLQQAIEQSPCRADFRYQLGLILASAEDTKGAMESLQEALRLAPMDPAVHQNLAMVLAARGEVVRAVRHLAIAQKLRPHDAYLAMLLTLAVQASQAVDPHSSVEPAPVGEFPHEREALDALSELITQDPDFVEAFLCLPESHVDPEIFAMLAEMLELALERHPEYADLHYHCSRVYARIGRTDSAISAADRAVRINPGYVQALIQIGKLYAQTDRSEEAVGRLQTAIQHGGDYPDVHHLLGELYRHKGRIEQARAAFTRALELNSNYRRAQSALAELASA